jgi:hypothetical protein
MGTSWGTNELQEAPRHDGSRRCARHQALPCARRPHARRSLGSACDSTHDRQLPQIRQQAAGREEGGRIFAIGLKHRRRRARQHAHDIDRRLIDRRFGFRRHVGGFGVWDARHGWVPLGCFGEFGRGGRGRQERENPPRN